MRTEQRWLLEQNLPYPSDFLNQSTSKTIYLGLPKKQPLGLFLSIQDHDSPRIFPHLPLFMNKHFKQLALLIAALTYWAAATFAQTTIVRGLVIDSKKNEPLPFANVFFKGTTIGVQTDLDGRFELKSDIKGLNTLSAQYLGYEAFSMPIQWGATQIVTINMKEAEGFKIQDVVIIRERRTNKDTAAIRLYRRIVANRKVNKTDMLDTYSFEEYTKTQFDMYNLKPGFKNSKVMKSMKYAFDNLDTFTNAKGQKIVYLPALLRETMADIYFVKRLGKKKEIVKAEKFTGIKQDGISDLVGYTFDDIDIYKNTINLSGKPFVGPFGEGNLGFYKYFIQDTFVTMNGKRYSHLYDNLAMDDNGRRFIPQERVAKLPDGSETLVIDTVRIVGDTVIQMGFAGVNNQDNCFAGSVEVELKTAIIMKIDMEILPQANINFVNDFKVKQDFKQVNGTWFMVKESKFIAINLTKNEAAGSLRIINTVMRDSIFTNPDIPTEKVTGDETEYLEDRTKKDENYWLANRHEDLVGKAKGIDETIKKVQSTRAFKLYEWLGYLGTTAFLRAGPVEFGRFYNFVSWNNIEGTRLRFGGRTRITFSKVLNISAYAAYGLGDKEWKYRGKMQLRLPAKNNRWRLLEGSYTYDLSQITNPDALLSHDNLLTSLLRKPDAPIGRLMKSRIANITYEHEWVKGFQSTFAAQHVTSYTVKDLDGISVFDFRQTLSDGSVRAINSFTTSEVSLRTRWNPGQKFIGNGFSRIAVTFSQPQLNVDMTFGIKGILGSQFNYQKFQVTFGQRLPWRLGYTRYSASAGIILGDVPYPFMNFAPGNQGLIFNRFSYNMMNEFEFVNDRWAGAMIEHHFDGFLFNKVPLLRKLKLREVLSFNVLWGELANKGSLAITDLPTFNSSDPKATPLGGLNGKPYMECGAGIENIFGIGRIDFMWRLTQRDLSYTIPWSIKIALQPKF